MSPESANASFRRAIERIRREYEWLSEDHDLALAILQARAGMLRIRHPLADMLARHRSAGSSALLIAAGLISAAVPSLAVELPRVADGLLPERNPDGAVDAGLTLIQGFRLPDSTVDDVSGPVMPVGTGAPAWSTDIRAAFGESDQSHGLSFSATLLNGSPLPGWVRIDAASGILQVAPGPADDGTFRVKVTARDSSGAEVTQLLVLSVSGGTAALVFASSPEAAVQFSDIGSNFQSPIAALDWWRPPASESIGAFEHRWFDTGDDVGALPGSKRMALRSGDGPLDAINRAPTITSGSTASVAENTTGAAYTVVATDADPRTKLTYSLQGADAGLFTIDPTTGVVTFRSPPDFEVPGDSNGDNVYDLVVVASDGQLASYKAVRITVVNVNEPLTASVVIVGTPIEDGTLTADVSSLADPDGIGTLTFQWLRNGVAISGANGASYTLGDADVGAAISVRITYTDNGGAVETITSGATAPVTNVNDAPTGGVSISGAAIENDVLTANTSSLSDADGLGTLSYQWLRDGVAISGANGATYTLGDADVAAAISVRVSYVDGRGTPETVTSTVTTAVSNVNDAPTGGVSITGTALQNGTLSADTSSLADADGLGALSYQWLRDGVAISGANASSYTLGNADVGTAISVRVSYVDARGTTETLTSAATLPVTNVNDAPTGVVVISGSAIENATLTAGTASLVDADGIGTLSHQWLRDGVAISGADGASYTLGDADVGAAISVRVTYTDGRGTVETLTSAATSPVANVNDAPTGSVVVVGTATEDATLTADTSSLADADGLGTLSYQWLRDGVAISGANGATYTLGDADVGAAISVRVSYTDGQGTAETVASSGTTPVSNVNDAPIGAVYIVGSVTKNATLTVETSSLSDADGLGTLSYQWLRDGAVITGATGPTHTLGNADVGAVISVRVSYTDGQGTVETVTSAATLPVTNVNDPPTGSVVITGSATEDATLTAVTSGLADGDGLGAFSYQWLRNDVVIIGATGPTYTLGDADVGASIKVRVSYTDGNGTSEMLTSAATGAVVNTNDAPTNLVVTGTLSVQEQVADGGTGGVVVDPAGTVVATLAASDEDVGDTLTYSIVSDPSSFFEIIGNTLVVKAGAQLDFETAASHVVTVAATDVAGASTQRTVTISVTNFAQVASIPVGSIFTGSSEEDSLTGGADNESISGGLGDDTIFGETGNDTLRGGAGNDYLDGGGNADLVSYAYTSTALSIVLDAAGGAIVSVDVTDVDTIAGFEAIEGGFGNDTLIGNASDNTLDGGLGDDSVAAGGGNDLIRGSAAGADTLDGGDGLDVASYWFESVGVMAVLLDSGNGSATFASTGAVDALVSIENVNGSGTGDDVLVGNGSSNVLNGSGGNDTIDGGVGADFLFGGTGSDTFHFVFAAGQSWGADTIASFEDGFDMIRVDVPVEGDITGLTFGDYFEIVTVGSDTLVTIKSGGPLTSNGESILISNVTASSITFADFSFI